MAQGLRYFSTAIVLFMLLLSTLAPVQAKDLNETDCKAESMQAEVLTAMNRQAVLNPPLRVERVEFIYLETARKPYFCAYMAYADKPDGYLFAVTPLASRSGKPRFKFDFLD